MRPAGKRVAGPDHAVDAFAALECNDPRGVLTGQFGHAGAAPPVGVWHDRVGSRPAGAARTGKWVGHVQLTQL